MSRYIGKRVSYPCGYCGKQFTLNKKSIDDSVSGEVFCSQQCFNAYQLQHSEKYMNSTNDEMKNETANGTKSVSAAGWISVNEKLPEHENNVLAVLNGQVCIMTYFSFKENGQTKRVWAYVYDGINGDGIYDDDYYPSHWMEIPCPPDCR